MAYFAKIVDGKVVKVMVADSDYFNKFVDDSPGDWIETFLDGGSRKIYAGIGMNYSSVGDKFYAPQPYDSWVKDVSTASWVPPTADPGYSSSVPERKWNETNKRWEGHTALFANFSEATKYWDGSAWKDI